MRKKAVFLVAFCLFCYTLSTVSLVQAEGGEAIIGVRPVFSPSQIDSSSNLYFKFVGRPGGRLTGGIFVRNTGSSTGSVEVYGVDAATGATSGTTYQDKDAPRQDVGKWLTLGVTQCVLAPGEGKTVPFTVVIPDHVRAGDHVGGIVAELDTKAAAASSSSTTGTFLLRTRHLTIIAVQITLPGPLLEQIQVGGIQAGVAQDRPSLIVTLRNTGTMMLKPQMSLTLTKLAQKTWSHTQSFQLDTLLPQTMIHYPIALHFPGLQTGTYQALLVIYYGHQKILQYQNSFLLSSMNPQYANEATSMTKPSPSEALFSVFSFWLLLPVGFPLLGFVFVCGYLFARKASDFPSRKKR